MPDEDNLAELAKQEKKRQEDEQDAAEEAELLRLAALEEAAELEKQLSTPNSASEAQILDEEEQKEQAQADAEVITKEMYEEKQAEIELLTHQLEEEREKLSESQKVVADLREELAIAFESQKHLQSETEQIKQKQRIYQEKMQ